MPTIVGILTIIIMINTISESLQARKVCNFQHFRFYEQLKFRPQLSWAWKKFYNLGPDTAWCDVWSGSSLFAYVELSNKIWIKGKSPLNNTRIWINCLACWQGWESPFGLNGFSQQLQCNNAHLWFWKTLSLCMLGNLYVPRGAVRLGSTLFPTETF